MRTYIFVMCWLIPGIICAQEQVSENLVPEAIKKSFDKKFPKGEVYSWFHDENNHYVVEFYNEDLEFEAGYEASGQWLYTISPIEEFDIPNAVRNTVLSLFTAPIILDSYFKQQNGGKDQYIIMVENEQLEEDVEPVDDETDTDSSNLFELVLDKEGKVISKNHI